MFRKKKQITLPLKTERKPPRFPEVIDTFSRGVYCQIAVWVVILSKAVGEVEESYPTQLHCSVIHLLVWLMGIEYEKLFRHFRIRNALRRKPRP